MTVSKYEKVSRELLLAALTVGFSLLTGHITTTPRYKNLKILRQLDFAPISINFQSEIAPCALYIVKI
jgi:hypothetical protein